MLDVRKKIIGREVMLNYRADRFITFMVETYDLLDCTVDQTFFYTEIEDMLQYHVMKK